jgi:hypothetical protein
MSAFPTGVQANYVPEIFSKKLLARFKEQTILESVTNTDYQGEISGQGSKVIIRHSPEVGVTDYTGTDLTYALLGEGTTELVIDRAKVYTFRDEDVHAAQRDIKSFISEATKNAADSMRIEVEKDLFGSIYADAGHQMNDGAATPAALAVGKNDVIDLIVDTNVKFDEENIPREGRFIILPAWACGLIRKSDLKDASITGDGTGVIRTGMVGSVDGTAIYSSNCLTVAGGGVHALAGTRHATSFASQFVKNEKIRLQERFGDAYRGLKVYGFKVVKPECLIDVWINKA